MADQSGAGVGILEEERAPTPPASATSGVARHTLIYGAGLVLTKGIGMLMLPVYTRFLTPADYGVMELIEMTLELISIAAGAQIALGIFRYYHKATTARDKDAVVSTALIALSLSYAAVGLGSFLGAGAVSSLVFGTPEHAKLLRIASATLAFQSLMIVPLAHARVQDRSMRFIVANLARTGIAVTLNIYFLVFLDLGVQGILTSSLISSVLVGSWLTASTIRHVGLRLSRQSTRDLLRYGLPMVATQLATFTLTFGDRYFLQATSDSTVVGLYTLAYQFGFIVALFGAGPFMRVWDPKRFAIAHREDRDEVYARGFIYLNLLLLTMALFMAVFIRDVLHIMTPPAYHSAASIVPILVVAYVLQSWTGLQDIGILVKERTEFVMLGNWIAAGTALLGYWLLVPLYLGHGAAVATVIAFAVRHIVIVSISQWLWPVAYQWAPVLRILGVAIVVYCVSLLVPHDTLWLSVAMRVLLMLTYAAVVWHMDVLSKSDRVQVRVAAAKLGSFLKRHSPLRGEAASGS
jgi:O-antigen/teichoic acid export membrane protein